MDFILIIIDYIVHIDSHLGEIFLTYGKLSYLIIFGVIFAETGFVFTPFLPGDSLLFASGAFAALSFINIYTFLPIIWLAAVLGDNTNYWIGYIFGKKIIDRSKISFINNKHMEKTKMFYKRHGGKTIFLARFVPIIRTFAPFVAGIGKMYYPKFLFFSVFGGFVWVFGFTLLGYFFGNLDFVKENFSLVILAIVVISLFPAVYEYLKEKYFEK